MNMQDHFVNMKPIRSFCELGGGIKEHFQYFSFELTKSVKQLTNTREVIKYLIYETLLLLSNPHKENL